MKYYKKTDKTRPRFRISKYRYNLINKDLHKSFVEKTGIKMTWKEFKDIAGAISDEYVKIAIEERDGVALAKGMGNVYLALYPFSREAVEYLRTKATEDMYHHFFKEFDGKVTWDFRCLKYRVKNRMYWSFKPHRNFKTAAHHAFLEQPERYKRVRTHERNMGRIKIQKLLKDEYNIIERGNQPDPSPEQGS